MIQIIRNRGLAGILLGVLVIILSKCFFEEVPDFPQVTYTPLFAFIKSLVSESPFFDITLGLAFIVIQASMLTFFLNYHKVIKERSFFPFILYIVLAGVYNEQFYLNPASFLNFFLILIIDRMLRLQDSGKNPGVLFLDIGTLAGLSILFSKEALFYLPIIFIGVVIIYAYNWNSVIIMSLTVFIVLFITACIYFLTNQFSVVTLFFKFTPINLGINFSHWQERFYLLLILILIISAVSFFNFQFNTTKITNKVRRFTIVFVLFWIIGIMVVLFQKLNLWYNMALTVIPMTVFATNFFQDEKGRDWFKNLMFIIIILGLISIQMNY